MLTKLFGVTVLTRKIKNLLREQPYTIQEIHDRLGGKYPIPSLEASIRYLRHCDIGVEAIGNRATRHYYLSWYNTRQLPNAYDKVLGLLQKDVGEWWTTCELVAVTDLRRNTVLVAINKLIKDGYNIEKDKSTYPYSYRLVGELNETVD